MNERFNTLAEQAGFYVSESRREILAPESNVTEVLREFAELIVRDCLDIAFEVRGKPATDTHYVIGYDRACEKMIDAIKESYGVEE